MKEYLAWRLVRGEPAQLRRVNGPGHLAVPHKKEHVMTTRTLDRRDRSKQITLLTSITAGVAVAAVVAFMAFGGGGVGDDDGTVVPPVPSARPSAPAETPAETPAATPGPDETPTRTPLADDGGSDAMPIKVDLANATGADVHVDIADETGLLVGAQSGSPGDGMSVDAYTLKVENLDASTLGLTWVDFPIDNALALYIMDDPDGAIRLVMVQPEPTGPADAIGFDRELILSFSQPVSADEVVAFLQDGLDTPG
jgi:hypothetical protein